ncbi:SdpA family antimicrobial peptide system protein [Marinoscillum pacificum]|uniref:SdpA family antimicrobial peptide system protein n=1 Tax=Marinoscillum pacificum TaxID=392723 RepID=UPI0021586C73|nr:SdpA family antimicrobial peptide system protein [Marinoscillum pacificum]
MNKVRLIFVALSFLYIYLIVGIALRVVPTNPITISSSRGLWVGSLFPEGFKFFTKNPREPVVQIYEKGLDGSWEVIRHYPNFKSQNLFGIKRESRAIGLEVANILKYIKPEEMISIARRELKNIDIDLINVPADENSPIMCGEFLISSEEPIPWAWLSSFDMQNQKLNVVHINIDCNSNN